MSPRAWRNGAILGLALWAVIGGLVFLGVKAAAVDPQADKRPCVANREANSLHGGLTRQQVETRWEVGGRGRPLEVVGFGRVVTYPWCDHGSRARAWVGVVYSAHGIALTEVWWRADAQGDGETPSSDAPCPECQVLAPRQVSGKAALPAESRVAR